jgi:hypothetical protein
MRIGVPSRIIGPWLARICETVLTARVLVLVRSGRCYGARGFALAAITGLTFQAAAASEAAAAGFATQTIAVATTLGREIEVVEAQSTAGTRLDRNRKQTLPTEGNALSQAILLAASDEIERRCSGCVVKLVQVGSDLPSQPDMRSDAFKSLILAASDAGATRLLLIAPRRAEPLLATASGTVGHGYVTGLGFYLARGKAMRRGGEMGRGFIAPYASFSMQMYNVQTGLPLADLGANAGRVIGAYGDAYGDPWQAIKDERKMQVLLDLSRREISRLVPELLAP